MIAGDAIKGQARPWWADNWRAVFRACVPVVALGFAWWLVLLSMPVPILFSTIAYSVAQLLLLFLRRFAKIRKQSTLVARFDWVAIGVDVVFAGLIIYQASSISVVLYPLYLLLAFRAVATYRRLPLGVVTPFVFGPFYLFAQYNGLTNPTQLLDRLTGLGILVGSLGLGITAIWVGSAQQRVNAALRRELRSERLGREARINDLERSTNDLRARMRQLHALEEGLRVITSTLSLDEVLNQIIDSTVQMLGGTRVQNVALSLATEQGFEHRFFGSLANSDTWASSLAQRAIQQQVPLILADASLDAELGPILPVDMRAVLCVPLYVGDEPVRGALTIISQEVSAFSSSDARHLTALAMQAGIAIHNAELHSKLRGQQRLLNAVVRDINDGLVVVDDRSQVVLANPIGRTLLETESHTQSINSQLMALASSIRTEGHGLLTSELELKSDDGEAERVYQAFGSQVHHNETEEPLVAIVLRDITQQKEEEKSRTEFISMVSHELRNPLNSLNGFIKIVLRGQAGALTPLQTEFLTIADGQVEQLKGRISELLEYNRVEAGRLVLDPQWHDLSLLVTGTTTRLKLNAEQAGLTLINEVASNLPETYFDSERIGQVLNNLIENAIKATPPGGSITLRSELYEDEIWVRVCDTGVGIPAEEQSKIFQRFYRAHNRTSSQGNHLGLGLAICQQIIASHNGRLWVESEEGRGTCFTFSLPLVNLETAVNA